MVKMESVPDITIFGQKVIVKSGLELFIFEIPPLSMQEDGDFC